MLASQSTMKQLQARPKAHFTTPLLGVTGLKARRPTLAYKQACNAQRSSVKAAAVAEGRTKTDRVVGKDAGGWFTGRGPSLTPDATVDLPALTGVSQDKGAVGVGYTWLLYTTCCTQPAVHNLLYTWLLYTVCCTLAAVHSLGHDGMLEDTVLSHLQLAWAHGPC
jgi:hypothetical protein